MIVSTNPLIIGSIMFMFYSLNRTFIQLFSVVFKT